MASSLDLAMGSGPSSDRFQLVKPGHLQHSVAGDICSNLQEIVILGGRRSSAMVAVGEGVVVGAASGRLDASVCLSSIKAAHCSKRLPKPVQEIYYCQSIQVQHS